RSSLWRGLRDASSIPIVIATGGDPVATGLVKELARPGRNITGVYTPQDLLLAKRVEIAREILPNAHRLGFVFNRRSIGSQQRGTAAYPDARAAAAKSGFEVVEADISEH